MPKGTPGRSACLIDGCEKPHQARGWCHTHWRRWRKHGDPLWKPPTATERFWSYVNKDCPDGFHSQTGENLGPCWLWTGVTAGKGYGHMSVGGRKGRHVYAHRFSYELLTGPIPNGLELDHLCRVHNCANPDHLEPVTHIENTLRGDAGAHWATKTHCLKGHEYTPENTYIYRGGQCCRTCSRARRAAYEARKRVA